MFYKEDKAWQDWLEVFDANYETDNYENGFRAWCMKKSHELVERPFGPKDFFSNVLEIGAGSGIHHQFVRHKYSKYTMSDHNPKILDKACARFESREIKKITFQLLEGESLPFGDEVYDRVVAVHVLEHIYRPHLAIKEWSRVIRDGGVISVLIPTDPGIAWRFGQTIGARPSAIKRGLAYDYIMAREHVNSCTNLLALLRHYFPHGSEGWWPLPISSVDLNLFVAFNAKIVK